MMMMNRKSCRHVIKSLCLVIVLVIYKFYALSIYCIQQNIYIYILKANNLFFVTVGNNSAKNRKGKTTKKKSQLRTSDTPYELCEKCMSHLRN